ncbi:synaptogenesis protein syg-2-like [Mytilus edulis]|uniref:synaptogenesis protein syg-2-like n=1 Tax=Mytilus edulis TaxID=6550 RepID=UPI0039EE0276
MDISVFHLILIHVISISKVGAQNGGQISLKVKPLDGTAVYGDVSYTIECTITGTQATAWSWSKQSNTGGTTTTIFSGTKYSIDIYPNATDLTINSVIEEDEQEYFCQATIGVGLQFQTISRLVVNGGLLTVTISPAKADVLQGQSQLVSCFVTGEPVASDIRWYFTPTGSEQRQLLYTGNTAKYSGGNTQNRSLAVLNFQSSDSGTYVCSALNAVGTSTSSYSALRFISDLHITASLTSYSAIVGDSKVTMSCKINGEPPAIGWDWKKTHVDGGSAEIIAQGTNNAKRQIITSATNPNLNIFSITDHDRGIYNCRANNGKRHFISNPVNLKVLESSIRTAPGEPETSSYVEFQIGITVILSCSSTGANPPPSVIWLKDDIVITSGTNTTTSGNITTTTLTFTTSADDNMEVYECQVDNGFLRRPLIKTTYLTLKPSNDPPGQPLITGSHQYHLGDSIRMICRSTGGNPSPTLNWLRDGNVITNGISRSTNSGVTTSTLTFTAGLEDHLEVFECQADNGVLNKPLATTTYIEVYFAPKVPVLTGPTNMVSGSSGTWTCSSLNGYPAPTISIRIQDQHYTDEFVIVQSYDVIDRSYTVTGTLDVVPLSDKSGQTLCCHVSHLINNKVPQSVCLQLSIEDKEDKNIIIYAVLGLVAIVLLFIIIMAVLCNNRNGKPQNRNRHRHDEELNGNRQEIHDYNTSEDPYNTVFW